MVVLSYRFWLQELGGDPDVVGKPISLARNVYTVVGVTPPEAKVPYWGTSYYGLEAAGEEVDAWVSVARHRRLDRRTYHEFIVVGRLSPGLTLEQAQAEATRVARNMESENPHGEGHPQQELFAAAQTVRLESLADVVLSSYRLPTLLPLAAGGLLIVIACANVANMLLARGASRDREIALRTSLGAGRGRLFRQLVIENILLGSLASAGGLLVTFWGLRIFRLLAPPEIFAPLVADAAPIIAFPASEFALDGRVFGFCVALSLATTVLFGLLPAIAASRPSLTQALRRHGGAGRRGLSGEMLRGGFVVAQIGFSFLLLVAAGLLISSFWNLLSVDLGFDVDRLYQLHMTIPSSRFDIEERTDGGETYQVRVAKPEVGAFMARAHDELESIPAVESAAVIRAFGVMNQFGIAGRLPIQAAEVPEGERRTAWVAHVFEGDFLAAMGTRLLAGDRQLLPASGEMGSSGILVNEEFARRYFPDESPIGQVIVHPVNASRYEIIGVTATARYFGDLAGEPRPWIVVPYDRTRRAIGLQVWFVVRAAGNPAMVAAAIRKAISSADPTLPMPAIETAEQVVYGYYSPQRFLMQLLAFFAAVALALSVIGVYGVISYFVELRRREIGVRMALGARPKNVVTLVVRRTLILTLLGIVVGIAAAWPSTRVLESVLFGVNPVDPRTFAVIAVLLIGVALAASYLPARRAARTDPMASLRTE